MHALAAWFAVLRVEARVAPPIWARPRPQHAAKQKVDGEGCDGRARVQRRTDHIDKLAVRVRVTLGKPAVDKYGRRRAHEDDICRAVCQLVAAIRAATYDSGIKVAPLQMMGNTTWRVSHQQTKTNSPC